VFRVPTNETTNILNSATDRPLIILDEIGRGMSTYDGLSIPWDVVDNSNGDPAQGYHGIRRSRVRTGTQPLEHGVAAVVVSTAHVGLRFPTGADDKR